MNTLPQWLPRMGKEAEKQLDKCEIPNRSGALDLLHNKLAVCNATNKLG